MNYDSSLNHDDALHSIHHRAGYMQSLKDSIYPLVVDKCLKRGSFTLASGASSHYYFDSKPLLFDQRGIKLVALWIIENIFAHVDRSRPLAIGGPEIGAIPIASTVAALAPFDIQPFVVRKAPKDHGTQKIIEGNITPDATVILVEDVITTGKSVSLASQAVTLAGGHHLVTFCLVNRNGYSTESAPVISLFDAHEFIDT